MLSDYHERIIKLKLIFLRVLMDREEKQDQQDHLGKKEKLEFKGLQDILVDQEKKVTKGQLEDLDNLVIKEKGYYFPNNFIHSFIILNYLI